MADDHSRNAKGSREAEGASLPPWEKGPAANSLPGMDDSCSVGQDEAPQGKNFHSLCLGPNLITLHGPSGTTLPSPF